ncbi:MAG TPA: fructose-bisphosphate aldolase class II [Actinobacteria bacterium]|jgi:fructose-bisphosphate aldolase class II|nr:fructose-bisphosphate aldolase class II [Actinomycetota bacterium]
MPLVPMKQILDEAIKGGYGVGAYNVNNMEQIQGIMQAAAETESPVIIQASRGALKYTKMLYLKYIMVAAVEDNPNIPISIHLDHGNNFDTCRQAIELGFTSVMIDGSLKEDSKTPTTFDENVEVTAKVVEYAHKFGVTVEGELGTLGGIEDGVGSGISTLTDPSEAERFVKLTGVDALALAIGTSHGAYKFKEAPVLALDIVTEVKKRLPDTPLVMHGSSSVPKELIDIINNYGGNMKHAMGVPMSSIQEAIKRGIKKINVDTDGRLAITGAIRKYFSEHTDVIDPRDYFGEARKAVYQTVKSKMIDFGTAGHAQDYKPLALSDMINVYKK